MSEIKQKKNILNYENVVLVFLFLASMNFISRFYVFFFVAFLALIIHSKRLLLCQDCFAYILLSVSLMLFSPQAHTSVLEMIKPFAYIITFIIGYNLYKEEDYFNNSQKLVKLIIVLASGAFVHYALNLWSGNFSSRNTIDIWSKTILSATQQAALSVMAMGLSISWIFSNKHWIFKALGIAITVIILIYNLTLAGRTLFIIGGTVFVIALMFSCFHNDKRKYFIRTLAFVAIIIFVFIHIYNNNLFGIKNTILTSNFYNRFFGSNSMGLSEDTRNVAKLQFLKSFPDGIFGGNKLKNQFGYAHDLLLDGYDEGGFIALFALLYICVTTMINIAKIVRNTMIDFNYRLCILCVYCCFALEFFTEPIVAGLPWLMCCFCTINGTLTRYLRSITYEK